MEDVQNQIEEPVPAEMEPSELNTAHSGMRVSQHQEARLKRVIDYQADALKKENSLEAVLGTINAGLMGVTIRMEEFIEQALAANPKTIDRVHRLLPGIQIYLQATRQIDRLTQVELRVAASRKSKSAEPRQLRRLPKPEDFGF